MAFDALKKMFKAKLFGVGEDRIAVRTQGCWSCIHGGAAGYERAAKLWWEEARAATLQRGVEISLKSPHGENDERVKNVRRQVPLMDVQVEQHQWVTCKVGKDPKGNPVADFVASTYLCNQWSGAEGASIARAGKGPDLLPEEVVEKFETKGEVD